MTVHLRVDEKLALGLPIGARRLIHETPWLLRPVVATPIAIERLADWFAAGGLDWPAPNVRELMRYFGDGEMIDPVVAAIEDLPPPLRDWILADVTIFGSGWSTSGWTNAAPIQASPHLIVLSGHRRNVADVQATMRHEAAHQWLEYRDTDSRLPTAHVLAQRAARAKDEGYDDICADIAETIEARACALAAAFSTRSQQ